MVNMRRFIVRVLEVAAVTGLMTYASNSLGPKTDYIEFGEPPIVTMLHYDNLESDALSISKGQDYAVPDEIKRPKEAMPNALEVKLLPDSVVEKDWKDMPQGLREISERYSHLNSYDSLIQKYLDEFNGRLKPKVPLDLVTVKAQIQVETGGEIHRRGAFRYDPLQIVDGGDPCISVLAQGKYFTPLIGNFGNLNYTGKILVSKRTSGELYRQKGYDGTENLRGGIGCLFWKAARFDKKNEENGDIREYRVRLGDSAWKIAKNNGTTVSTLKKYNPKVDVENLEVGQVLKFRHAEEKIEIVGWRSWKEALARHNGGGDPDYVAKVFRVRKELQQVANVKAEREEHKPIVLASSEKRHVKFLNKYFVRLIW